jgi:hypothetical protein
MVYELLSFHDYSDKLIAIGRATAFVNEVARKSTGYRSRDFFFSRSKQDTDPHLSLSVDAFNLPNHVNYTSYDNARLLIIELTGPPT